MYRPLKPEIVTDEIIDNMAQGRKALGLIYSGDATYVINENENMGYYLPKGGTNQWSDAMVIPKNAKNPELAHAFINYASDYDGAYDNSSYVGYTSANKKVMEDLYGKAESLKELMHIYQEQIIKMMKSLSIMRRRRKRSVIFGVR